MRYYWLTYYCMIAFLIRRFFQALIVMLVISFISFVVQQELGDPLRELVGQSVSEAERNELRQELGLNDPFWTQYGRFLSNAVRGDLGDSYFYKEPALQVILKKLPATLELVIAATLIIVFVSMPLGIWAAVHPRHISTRIIMAVSVMGISIPVFLTGISLVYIFSITLHWLPSFGRGELFPLFDWWHTGFLTADGLAHLVLPSITLASIMLPLFIRLIRSEMLEVLSNDYIRFGWAKGLSAWRIYTLHAFKNTLLPVITIGGVQIGVMVAYTILTETIFQWHGMGFIFLEAVHRSDIPLIVAYMVFVGFIFVVANTLVDLTYGLVNPTIQLTGANNT